MVRMERQRVRWVYRPLAELLGGFAIVVVTGACVLLARGSLHDWYLQTIAFPRSFYLSYYGETGDAGQWRAAAVVARRFLGVPIPAPAGPAALRLRSHR